ncbi:MAG TPA: NAD/NADP octopine/nopaline dehydrogenase family protein [Candidatus Acidoferrales bacterium]|nr:NAD/NADP octopine/nopaline dehydrogenase family protein [Candidatus Acidoferrales bacterium]
MRRIAVLGAGNGGCAAAADLTLRGYEVRLYSRSQATVDALLDKGDIEIIENGAARAARPALISSDPALALEQADLVVVAAPAVAHEYLATTIGPHLAEEQIILLNPGHTGGSLHFAQVLRKVRPELTPRICETVTLTYICRLKGAGRVEVYRRTRPRGAAFPGKLTAGLLATIREVFPLIVPAQNVMETGLSNINAIMHPAGVVANAGWIERHSGDFRFYAEGISRAVANVIAKVDEERLKIVERLGLPLQSFVEIFYQAGLTSDAARDSGSVYEAIRQSEPNKTIKAPAALRHRYLDEDVPYGLVPMSELGKRLGVRTPVIDSLVELASAMNETDYRREGLTLARMGLAGVGAEELARVLDEGF